MHFCIFRLLSVGRFIADVDAAPFRQMEGGAQMHLTVPRLQRVAEKPVGGLRVIFGREAAQCKKIIPPRFAAIRGDGKGELYIFLIRGSDVRSGIPDRFGEEMQV